MNIPQEETENRPAIWFCFLICSVETALPVPGAVGAGTAREATARGRSWGVSCPRVQDEGRPCELDTSPQPPEVPEVLDTRSVDREQRGG